MPYEFIGRYQIEVFLPPVFDVKSVQVPVIGGRRRIFSKKEERRREQLPIAVTLSAPHPLRPPLPAITDSLQLIYFSVYNPKFSTISERRKWHSGLLTLWSGGCSPPALPGTGTYTLSFYQLCSGGDLHKKNGYFSFHGTIIHRLYCH